MKLKKILASAVAAVAAITSVASVTSCKKNDDDITDDGTNDDENQDQGNTDQGNNDQGNTDQGGNNQGGNEDDEAAEIQAKLDAAIKGLSLKSSYDINFTLPTTAAGGVTISWASDNVNVVKIENGKATVTRPGLTEADATVKITATAVIDGETKTKEFTITIPHVADESITIAEIKALEAGTKTAAKGIVTGFAYNEKDTETQSNVNVRSGFYLTDDTGTIYVFGKNAAAELSIGDEVYLNAEKSIYYGAHQLSYPADVVKLGENKTATFNNVIIDKTVTELATAPKPGDNETTNQGNVYELLAYFEKAGGSSYVNYRVVDPYNTSNYLNVYFTGTIVPGETYEFTEAYEAYVGKYCKIKFYMSGTNSSGKWRGHILGFSDLTEAEAAKMLLVEATQDIPAVIPVTASTAEIELPAVTLPTGAALEVTSTCSNVSYADGKITITKPTEDTTAEIKFAIKVGETVLTEYTKSVEIKVGATDITSLVTIENGVVYIPYNAITYAGEHEIDLGDGKKITINFGKYVDMSNYKELGLDKSGVITITATGVKLDALISDVYGSHDNMACYAGTDATGTAITATTGKDNGTTYTYAFAEAASNIYYVNTSDSYDVGFYDLQLVLEGSLNALKAEAEANRLAGLIESIYEDTATVDLSSKLGTVVITPQAGATTLTVDGTTLTVTPGATEITETITIKVTIGDAEFTTEAINVKSKAFTVTKVENATVTAQYTETTTSNMVLDQNNATLVNLKPILFNVTTNECGSHANKIGLNKEGTLRLYSNSDTNGSELTIQAQDLSAYGFELIINKITITYGGTVNAFTVNGTVGSKDTAEYTINDSKVVIKNTAESGQVHIKSIVIDYTIADKEPTEYLVDLTKTEFNLADDATMPTVEYDVYASVWGGTEPTGKFYPVDTEGKFDVIGSFTGALLVLIKKGEEPSWTSEALLAKTINYTVEKNILIPPFDGTEDNVEYTVDLSKIQYNLLTETTLPAEYDVYVTVWGGSAVGDLIAVDANGNFELLGDFTGAKLYIIEKGQTPVWEDSTLTHMIAETKDYTLTDTTIAGPFDGTEVPVAYLVDLSATKYNLKDNATMPTVEYDVYATVWGGTATNGTFIPVTLNGSFEVLGTFTNAALILIAKDQTPAWSGDNFLAQTADYTVSETTLVAPISAPVTHAEYLATETGKNITVKGTIIAFKSNKKEIYIQDTDGAYYLYFASKVESDWLVTGNTIVVNGTRGVRYSAQYIDNCSFVEKLDGEDVIEVTALDKTTDFTNDGFTNLSTSDEQRLVTFTGEWLGNNKVKVGEQTINLYFYCSAPTLVQNARYSFTGLLGFYASNSNITYQVQIFDANLVVDMRNDEEKAEDELDRLVALFEQNYTEATTIDLSSEIADVTVEITTAESTSLAWDATTKSLTITPTTTEVAETLTITVMVNQITKSDNTISFTTKIDENAPVLAATFTLGTDDTSKGEADGSSITEYTETSGNYTLTLENLSKVYHKTAYDASGNAVFKLGTTSAAGSFSFTVAEDVRKVVIYVAGYKSNNAKISINGGEAQEITTYSANSEYTPITIDTTTNKTVTFTTASGGYRCKINTIEFYA